MGSILSIELLFWVSIILAVVLNSGVGLIVFPLGVSLIVIEGKKIFLTPISEEKVLAEKTLMFSLVALFFILIFAFASN